VRRCLAPRALPPVAAACRCGGARGARGAKQHCTAGGRHSGVGTARCTAGSEAAARGPAANGLANGLGQGRFAEGSTAIGRAAAGRLLAAAGLLLAAAGLLLAAVGLLLAVAGLLLAAAAAGTAVHAAAAAHAAASALWALRLASRSKSASAAWVVPNCRCACWMRSRTSRADRHTLPCVFT